MKILFSIFFICKLNTMKNERICPICFDNLGRIYRDLPCGHRFHHKCLKMTEKKEATTHNCPYCRQEYENIKIRSRQNLLLSIKEKEMKVNFTTYIKTKLNECELASGKKNRLIIANCIYKKICENISMLLDPRFGFKTRFTEVVKIKVNYNFDEVKDVYKEMKITNEYNELCGYKNIINNAL